MQCATCGADVIEGQRFCRVCGVAVEPSAAPSTAAMPTDIENQAEPGRTSRATKVDTNPVGESSGAQTRVIESRRDNETRVMESDPLAADQSPAAVQPGQTNRALPTLDDAIRHQTNPALNAATPPAAGARVQPVPPYVTTPHGAQLTPMMQPKQSKGWMIALGGIALFGIIFLAALMIGRSSRPAPPVPTAPPTPSVPGAPNELYLSEEGADIDDEETVITQKFPLVGAAKFNLSNLSGDIIIEGVEGTEAQIKVIKTGGTVEERQSLKIIYSTVGGNLSLKSPQLLNNNVDIAYEVKLPRSLSQVNIQAVSSKVKVTNVDALVAVHTTSGAVELSRLAGAIRVETESGEVTIEESSGDIGVTASKSKVELDGVNGTVEVDNTAGETRAVFESSTLADSLRFKSVSGDIEVRFESELNAEMDARTTSGKLDVQGLGVEVKQSPGFSQAVGRVGIGGLPLRVETVSGNIKVKKS